MTIVQFRQPATQPTATELALIRSLPEAYVTLLGKMQPDGRLPEKTEITASSRTQMLEEANRLQEIMADRRPAALTKTVMFLQSVFPGQGVPAEAVDMLMMAYDMAMEDVPTWAAEEAARRWLSGKCGPKTFAPTPPELRCAADDVVLITKGKIASLRWLAKAEVATEPTPEQLARAASLANFIKVKPIDESEVS